MDTSDPEITFNEEGVCNHCQEYDLRAKKELRSEKDLQSLVSEIKKSGRGKKYDCVIGLSGGTDSSTVALLVSKLKLRPLAISLDNGWDTETSKKNVKRIVEALNLDLITYTVDEEEFKDLQKAFLFASVPNAEIPTDHAISALLFKTAVENKIKYIITGGNITTEAILPRSWGYDAKDLRYLRAIQKRFGKKGLKNFPTLSTLDWAYNIFVRKIKCISILNYINYNKKEAKRNLERFGWEDYGAKHGESIYTRFFQEYILPKKFKVDKRRAHLSTLICSKQITREEALGEMKQQLNNQDKDYVIRKLDLREDQFQEIMNLPIKSYKDFPNNDSLYRKLNFLVRIARKKVTNT